MTSKSAWNRRKTSGEPIAVSHNIACKSATALILLWPGTSRLSAWRDVPWYALIAGLLGLVLLSCLAFCIPRLGVASTMTLIIVGQLAVAAFLDHFGIFVEATRSFDLSRMAGMIVLMVGTWLMVR